MSRKKFTREPPVHWVTCMGLFSFVLGLWMDRRYSPELLFCPAATPVYSSDTHLHVMSVSSLYPNLAYFSSFPPTPAPYQWPLVFLLHFIATILLLPHRRTLLRLPVHLDDWPLTVGVVNQRDRFLRLWFSWHIFLSTCDSLFSAWISTIFFLVVSFSFLIEYEIPFIEFSLNQG